MDDDGKIHDIQLEMWGDFHKSKRDIETLPSTGDRIETIVYQTWHATSDVTQTQKSSSKLQKYLMRKFERTLMEWQQK